MADTQKFLKFKMGEYKNLAAATKSAGTVYITTDERAMYVDVSDSERIRVQGSVLYFNNLKEFTDRVAPPYSTDIIYFIAESNALMRYNGSSWVQLNATADSVTGAINDLTAALGVVQKATEDNANAIAANGTAIAGNATAIAGVKATADDAAARVVVLEGEMDAAEGRLDSAEERLQAVENDAEAAQMTADANADAIEAIQGAATALTDRVSTLETKMETAEGDITDLKSRATAVETKANNLETAIGSDSDADSIKGRIKTLEDGLGDAEEALEGYKDTVAATYVTKEVYNAKVGAIDTTIGSNEVKTSLMGRVYTLEDDVDKVEVRATGLENRMTAVEGVASANEDKISALETNVGKTYVTKTEFNNTKTALSGSIDTINTNIGTDLVAGKTLSGRITTLESDVNTAKGNITTLQGDVSANEQAISANEGKITGLTTRVNGIDEVVNGHTLTLTGVNSTLGEHTQAIAGHTSSIATLTSDLNTANGKIDDNAEAIESIQSAIGTNGLAGRVTALETKANTEAGKVTTLQGDVSDLKDRMTTAEGKITAAEGEINTIKGQISDAEDAIATKASKEELAQAKTDLTADINAHIQAANAMRYMGSVNGKDKVLPSLGVKVGDTYAVSEAFGGYLPGDLLIAKGDETGVGEDAVITANLAWEHVSTGYDAKLENSLVAEGNTISLLNYADVALAGVAIVSDTMTVAANSTKDALEMNIVWGSF